VEQEADLLVRQADDPSPDLATSIISTSPQPEHASSLIVHSTTGPPSAPEQIVPHPGGSDQVLATPLLTPPRRMSLEQAIAYIEEDELVEVTPTAIRLRKRYLGPHRRKKHAHRSESEAA
jgi:hypothetical protein